MKAPLQASITKVTTMRDKTVRLQVDCQEMHPEHMAEVFALNDNVGWFFFHEQPIKEIDTSKLPEIKSLPGKLSKSQELRNKLFTLHIRRGGTEDDFQAFYDTQMDRFIEAVNEKLN